ncbi:S41 family peptidase [Aquisalibacillus elongatus]|uniref:Carboxyl-terminal processing protease n=1 Tax=Aquisalibacillus elongatus TaxID=485577 RepID=A0A3N5C7N0_9BACI|nr:S41 family peptidase [Aquisalibacillus elongatus]RPF54375.1 carboxyl-terminal processing protease [Aquisalibacillus elongatus]
MNISKRFFITIVIVSLLVGAASTAVTLEMLEEDQVVQQDQDDQQNGSEQEENDQDESNQSEESNSDLDVLSYAMNLIESDFVSEVSREELIEGALEGVVNKLDDPYSEYMDAEAMGEFQSQIESTFEGIGAEVTKRDDYITVIAPIKDTPAENAGIRPNDRIIEVDGESLEGYTVYEAVTLIRGEKGTDVTLTIDRPGEDEPFEVVITRDTIPVTTVYSSVEEHDGNNVGVLEIRSFSEKTHEEFAEELEKLENEENIDGLVIDVRGNPGGLLESVRTILGHFLNEDDPFLQVSSKDQDQSPYYLQQSGDKDYPISVLINEGSASASEIMAAAMKENGGYDVVGQTSFGKGTVQQTVEVGDGLLKMTVMNWLSPEGNQINEVGIEPTAKVEQPEYYYVSLIQTDEPLAYDMNSQEVNKMQVMLDGLGYEPGRTDGYFDRKTESALESFQQDNGLDVTGTLNEQTEDEIEQQILDLVQDPDSDRQLQRAVELLFE